MGEELTRSLTTLAERGTPKGSLEVLEGARREAAPQSRTWRRGVAVAVGAAVAVLIVAGASILLLGPFGGEEPTPVVTELPEPVTLARLPSVTLVPATDVEPVLASTGLGDLEFTTLRFPTEHLLWSPLATNYGFVAIDEQGLRWSNDGMTWEGASPADPPGRLTPAGSDVVAYGGTSTVRYEWDGEAWLEKARLDLPTRIGQIVFGPRGAVAVRGNTIYYAPDGEHFRQAERGPSRDQFVAAENVPEEDLDFHDCRLTAIATANRTNAVLATDAGFVALTSAAHPDGEICAPLLWFSADGGTWDLVSEDSPFGRLSIVNAGELWGIAEHNGRFVTIGRIDGQSQGEPRGAVWMSNDGLTWAQADVSLQALTVAGGEMGWMLTGSVDLDDSRSQHMWFSADGLAWDGPYELPAGLATGWFRPELAVGSDTIFGVGIGSGTSDFTPVVARLQE